MSSFYKRTELTRQSHNKIKDRIIKLDYDIRLPEYKNKLKTPSLRIYKSKHLPENKSKNAIVTMLIIDENYVPGVLALAESLRLLKTTSKLVCLVQDKSYLYNDKKIYGVSQETIDDLLLLYDEVIGIDLMFVKNYQIPEDHFTNASNYSNIFTYCTKMVVLGLLQFDKVLYIDASTLVEKNVDYIFNKYNKSTFQYDNEWEYGNVGLRGTYFLVIPDIYFYNKGLLFVEDYKKYFGDNFFIRGVDEVIIYYAVYPHWSEELLDTKFGCNGNPSRKQKEGCDIYFYQKMKPFREPDGVSNKYKKHLYSYYKFWDNVVLIMLQQYPQLEKYYDNIKEYRETNF